MVALSPVAPIPSAGVGATVLGRGVTWTLVKAFTTVRRDV